MKLFLKYRSRGKSLNWYVNLIKKCITSRPNIHMKLTKYSCQVDQLFISSWPNIHIELTKWAKQTRTSRVCPYTNRAPCVGQPYTTIDNHMQHFVETGYLFFYIRIKGCYIRINSLYAYRMSYRVFTLDILAILI